ncbi:MAG: hypothetical protein HRT35_29110 [Algicola sp.]|nr:hypothetical protein [Algicola sp.]
MIKHNRRFISYGFLLALLLGLGGCQLTLVAPFDPETRSMLVRYSVEVDVFWVKMQQHSTAQRQYVNYQQRYEDIELNMLVLLKLNQMRNSNTESIKQLQNLLTLWQQDKANHRQKNGFKDFILKRRLNQYQRMFNAMLAAEDAKNI